MPSPLKLHPQPRTADGPAIAVAGSPPDSLFPGWRWAIVGLAFPIAGLIGWAISGPVDAPVAAVVGGTLTGAGLGSAQWLAARDAFGAPAPWVAASAVGYGLGLAAGAALVGYETDIGSLAAMGAISGAVLGAAQGLVLAAQHRRQLALVWAASMPALLAAGWTATTAAGIGVDKQFTVFGAVGAVVFTVLSGWLLTRFPTNPAPRI